MCGCHNASTIMDLLAAIFFILHRKPVLWLTFLALSGLSEFLSLSFLLVILRRARRISALAGSSRPAPRTEPPANRIAIRRLSSRSNMDRCLRGSRSRAGMRFDIRNQQLEVRGARAAPE
jgi:hypothetical protein